MDGDSPLSTLDSSLLDATLPTPLYHQIYLVLRERIRRGDLSEGAVLPGEQELAKAFDVSRITVKRALNELASERLVSRHRGRGTIVAGGATLPMVSGSFDTLLESLKIMGLETQIELLEVQDDRVDAWAADRLELEVGAPVQRAVRLRKLQGEPFSHLVTYVPAEIAARYSREELASTPLLTLLERAGAKVVEAEQWITAAGAEPHVASALRVDIGSPLLKIERIMRKADGQAVQLIVGHYRPDRFQYHFTSKRRRGDEPGWS